MYNVKGLLAAILLICLSGVSAAQSSRQNLDIKSQPMGSALRLLAEQTGLQIMFRAEDIEGEGVTAPEISGEFTVREALENMLKNTRLTYRFVNPTMVLVSSSVKTTANAVSDSALVVAQADAAVMQQVGVQDQIKDRSRAAKTGSVGADNDSREQIVVTGTHIRGKVPAGSPLTVYERRAIERSGATSVEQFMRTLPQNFGGVDPSTARVSGGNLESNSNSFFGAAANLHGLGSAATLVLVNGRRFAPAGSDGAFVDISMIPLNAVERVEVLSDGASAIYGADAVAGVVNFILRSDYTGAQTSVRYGDTTRGGSAELGASQMLGGAWNTGNAMLVYDYRDQDPLLARQRDFVPTGAGGFADTFTLMPQDRRHAVFATVRQAVGAGSVLSLDGFFSRRRFANSDISASRTVETYIDGAVEQSGAMLGWVSELPAQWQLNFAADYSHLEQAQTQRDVVFSTVRPFSYDSGIAGVDVRAEGPLFVLPGGAVRASIGLGGRKEEFNIAATAFTAAADLDRKAWSVYGELLLPLVERRLDLSIAGRHDDYNDFGSATEPKLGLTWQFAPGLALRGTYARAFRTPTLTQLHEQSSYALISVPNASEPDGYIHTIFILGSGNAALQPERSRSFTAGIDFQPQDTQLKFSATYFSVDFSDRIAGPPLVGSIFGIYTQPAVTPFITRPADAQRVAQIVSGALGPFLNQGGPTFTGINPALTEAFFDYRPANIAQTKESGFDFDLRRTFATQVGDVELFIGGTRLFEIRYRSTPTVPEAELLNKTYRPMDLRLQGGASWVRGPWASALTLHYSDSYENDRLTPTGRVASWLTTDLQLTYVTRSTASAWLRDTTLSIGILNLTDKDPPFVQWGAVGASFNYDPSNASPRGRFVSIQAARRW